jgi:copper oxidase (laccase) domain-containing protein
MGLLEGIVEAGVAALGGGPIAAIVGPGIGPCCYEVGEDILAAYRGRLGKRVIQGRNLDLWTAARDVLSEAGVEAVEGVDVCTACDDRFFSHRRDGPVTGRQGVIGYVT